jgi:hypothetical protein
VLSNKLPLFIETGVTNLAPLYGIKELQKLEKIDFYYSNPCKEIHSIKEFNQLVF